MSRKNRKAKFKQMHQKDLVKNQVDNEKFELHFSRVRELANQVEEVDMGGDADDNQSKNGMEIECIGRQNKIKKNKLFQKRAIVEEKKRLKRCKRSPVLVSSKRMQVE